MKRFLALFLVLALLCGLLGCSGTANKKNGLKVGFGRASILPKEKVTMDDGMSEGYLDELSTTCIAISEGDETILLFTIDMVSVYNVHIYNAQNHVSEATGVPVENIILSCTHTHTSYSIASSDNSTQRETFWQACADAGVAAMEDLSAAEVYYGSDYTENITFIRHYYTSTGGIVGVHQGTVANAAEHEYDADEEIQVIRFSREDKKDVVMMNCAAHPHMASQRYDRLLSADWPGAARTYVEENTDSLCAVFQSDAGDTTPCTRFPELSLDGYRMDHVAIGNSIGEVCVSVLNGEMTKAEGSGIKLSVQEYTRASMKEGIDNDELMKQAANIHSLRQSYGIKHAYVANAVALSDIDTAYEASGLIARQNNPDTYTMELHALAVDGISFIFAPFEMFTSTGLSIKENSPYDMTFLISDSESSSYHMGYIPDENGCEKNYYEYDITKFARGTAEDLAKVYVEILTDIKNAD